MASSSSQQPSSTPATSFPSSQRSDPSSSSPLATLLASSLPPSSPPFNIHHVSHAPTRCNPLYSPPPGQKSQTTQLTSHILALSSRSPSLLVYAIEIHIYTTRSSTTLFVSKADSTGFLPRSTTKPTVSPIRAITTAFLEYLIKETRRPGIPTHLTLFARAQDQYLFPNSVRNKSKHVLSDIQLIRWWARGLDPLLSSPITATTTSNSSTSSTTPNDASQNHNDKDDMKPKAYILVPGLDATDLRNVIPSKSWIHSHPYSSTKPVRESIPHFEDDPKSRFMTELEDGGWKGVRNMKEFWELMAFRQECSLGKSVGFLSVMFDSTSGTQPSTKSTGRSRKRRSSEVEGGGTPRIRGGVLPIKSEDIQSASTYTIASLLRNPTTREVISRRSSTMSSRSSSFAGGDVADGERKSNIGGRVLSKRDYDRLMASLLDSDFEGLKCAKESSELWIKMAGGEELPVVSKEGDVKEKVEEKGEKVNLLTVRKKGEGEQVTVLQPRKKSEISAVNVLQPRKKEEEVENQSEPVVNMLQPRKKVKVAEQATPVANVLQPRKREEPVEAEIEKTRE
ncbi:hypothetical protein AA313_de0201828 [Arthrobotrys entomopaga]|nr:hypothetical protein AA313_de0201828 [Arthrobotrys entomopaga]